MRDIGGAKQRLRHRCQHEEGDEQADPAIRDERPCEDDGQDCALGASLSVINLAIASTEPLSSISLPNRAPSRNKGKNCARNPAALPMKVCVQCASSGSRAAAAAISAAAGAISKTLQPR